MHEFGRILPSIQQINPGRLMRGHTKPAAAKPLKAVFFLEQLPMLAPLIAAWANAGHEIAAVVMPKRHNARLEWLAGRLFAGADSHWSLPGAVRRHAPEANVIWLPQPMRWEKLAQRLKAFDADVLISAFFPRRIPDAVLSAFRHGGVNLHPSRLPHFRGPSPLQHLLLKNAWREHGGVTLHRMTTGLDEGEIVAFAALEEEHWLNRDALDRALAGAMATLVAGAIPAWCRGEAGSKPQPEGSFDWAGEDAEMTVDTGWTAEHLRRLLTFFGDMPGVYLKLAGKNLRLGTDLTVLGKPQGKPPAKRGESIEFDLADARVSCRHRPWLARLAAGATARLAMRRLQPSSVAFELAAKESGDPRN